MNEYQKYRLVYLAYRLDQILMDDILTECEFVLDVVNNHVRRIRV